jgi:hypothetical protein
MLELILYYILPNVVMFGGLYGLAKLIEYLAWQGIIFSTK